MDVDINSGRVVGVNLVKGEQKAPQFIKLNPNGAIPVITDRSRDNFTVFESGAILLYLAEHYDKDHVFSFDPTETTLYSEMVQWVFFAVSRSASQRRPAHH
jgi:glutathione S-transferase